MGLDAGNGEDTFLLLDLVAVLTVDVLWGWLARVSRVCRLKDGTYGSLDLGLQSALGQFVHCARDFALELSVDDGKVFQDDAVFECGRVQVVHGVGSQRVEELRRTLCRVIDIITADRALLDHRAVIDYISG